MAWKNPETSAPELKLIEKIQSIGQENNEIRILSSKIIIEKDNSKIILILCTLFKTGSSYKIFQITYSLYGPRKITKM